MLRVCSASKQAELAKQLTRARTLSVLTLLTFSTGASSPYPGGGGGTAAAGAPGAGPVGTSYVLSSMCSLT